MRRAEPSGGEKERKGFFQRLKERLAKTKEGVISQVKGLIRLRGKVDEELLDEIEEILIQADLGVQTTGKIIGAMRQDSAARGIKEPEQMIELFKDAILKILSEGERFLIEPQSKPFVMFVVGVNGTGKTTTIGKLAKRYGEQGKRVMLVAGDTFRAAAIEQLAIWAKRSGSEIVQQAMGADPAAVCYDALQAAQSRGTDVVIIDTAGRLHTKVNLMEELKKMVRVIKKVVPDAPHETLLVLDATTGQNAINQAKIFSEAVNVTGIVMTKLDGTAKGGILIAIRDLYRIPVLLIGVGEKLEDLRDFDAEEFVNALFEE
jgi:fused signal recognition particle receptor